jgi:hypothetical protein
MYTTIHDHGSAPLLHPGPRQHRARSCRMKSSRVSRQPSGGLSICKGVQLPTETLPIGLEARQRVSVLFQTHALALKKLAFLAFSDVPRGGDQSDF